MRERNIKLCKVNKAKQNDITIHSKYFSVSGWPYQTDDVKGAEKLQVSEHLSRKPGKRLSCFGTGNKKSDHFTHFTRKNQANYWKKNSKNRKKTNQRSTSTINNLENICEALAPKLDIDGGKHVLACF